MATNRKAKPEAVVPERKVVTVVCTVCGQDWDKHGDDPSLADCVRLLKAELAKRPAFVYMSGTTGGSATWNNNGITSLNRANVN